jgi:hypothetical protein
MRLGAAHRRHMPPPRSADLQSAVSQVCSLLAPFQAGAREAVGHSADYKSAIRQIANLRYAKPTLSDT